MTVPIPAWALVLYRKSVGVQAMLANNTVLGRAADVISEAAIGRLKSPDKGVTTFDEAVQYGVQELQAAVPAALDAAKADAFAMIKRRIEKELYK